MNHPLTGEAAEIVFDKVTKRYPGRSDPAVNSLSLIIPAGDLCVLVGPSGGGKTTAMRMVNRLIDITEGDIRIDGRSVRTLEPTQLRRGIGYVIQQVGLFPHMTVAGNIGTVPRLLGWERERIRARTRELVELVGLDPDSDLDRYPAVSASGWGWPGRWPPIRR
jgi:osmoprotectant transport system ATP-binding protein